MTATSRRFRGRETECVVAQCLRANGWPYAEWNTKGCPDPTPESRSRWSRYGLGMGWLLHHIHSDQITAWATVVLGLGTIWLARTTSGALRAAQQDTREATKARMDAPSPVVAITPLRAGLPVGQWTIEFPELTPGEQPVLWRTDLHLGARIGLSGWFLASNEGTVTALVEIPPWVVGVDPGSTAMLPHFRGERAPNHASQFSLRPGDKIALYVEIAQTLGEWVAVYQAETDFTLAIVVKVADSFADGVLDEIGLELSGMPIGSTSNASQWRSLRAPCVQRVRPTVRNYRLAT